MPNFVLMVFSVTMITVGCRPASSKLTATQRTAIASEVNQTVADLFDAMNAHDPERVLSYHRNSEDFIYAGVLDVRLGWERFVSVAQTWYPANEDVTFTHEIVQTQVLSPTVATVVLRGKSSSEDDLLWSTVFLREGNRWKVALEHESWSMCTEAPRQHP